MPQTNYSRWTTERIKDNIKWGKEFIVKMRQTPNRTPEFKKRAISYQREDIKTMQAILKKRRGRKK